MAVSCFIILIEKSRERVLLLAIVYSASGTCKKTLILSPNALVHFPKSGQLSARGVNSLNSTDTECFNRSIEVCRSLPIPFQGFAYLCLHYAKGWALPDYVAIKRYLQHGLPACETSFSSPKVQHNSVHCKSYVAKWQRTENGLNCMQFKSQRNYFFDHFLFYLALKFVHLLCRYSLGLILNLQHVAIICLLLLLYRPLRHCMEGIQRRYRPCTRYYHTFSAGHNIMLSNKFLMAMPKTVYTCGYLAFHHNSSGMCGFNSQIIFSLF